MTTDTEEMEPQAIPLPPDELMIAVCGHAIHKDFARSRMDGPRQMLADFKAARIRIKKLKDVLDLGCGCGRFLAGWSMIEPPFQVHGCDYNPLLVKWCQENIPGIQTKLNALGDPIPFAEDSLDLVYLLSVFTHLTLAEQRRLVTEFHRIVRPEGYVLITFHGEHFYPKMFPMVPDGEAIFRREGFLIKNADQEGSNDCWTLQNVDNIVDMFEGFIPIWHMRSVDRGPTDVAAWQDVLILKKAQGLEARWYHLKRKWGAARIKPARALKKHVSRDEDPASTPGAV